MAFITTTADNISSGGAITGDLTIEGDLTVSGDSSGAYSEIVTDGLQITKDTDGEFVSLILVNESDAASTAGIISQRFDLEDTGGTAVDSGKILVGKEASFTATASTQDSYMALHTSLNGTLAEKMRITSAGNVGIGVTPEAIVSTHNSLQLGGNGYWSSYGTQGASGEMDFGHNLYNSAAGTPKYISTDEATLYRQGSGKHTFKSAASGSADAAISFTTNMILDVNSRISLSNNDAGGENTVFGFLAGAALASGCNQNVLFGDEAGNDLSSGALRNVAIGYSALDLATGCDDVVAIGANAIGGGIHGELGTIAIGSSALTSLTSGARNTAVGYEAGGLTTTGADNTYIGYQAGDDTRDDSKQNTVVGSLAFAGTHTTADADDCVAIGYSALGGVLQHADVAGTVAIGSSALKALTTGAGNTAVGFSALDAEDDGDKSTAVGYNALTAQTGVSGEVSNTAVGYSAGVAITTGIKNVIIGSNAGIVTTNVDNAVIIGQAACGDGDMTAAADGTVAVGRLAGYALTTGAGNVAIGMDALKTEDTGNYNTAVGHQALTTQNSTDAGNTAVGYTAGAAITTGYNNTMVGKDVMDALTAGSCNVALGAAALGAAALTEASNIAIGCDAMSAVAEHSGGSSSANNNIAIGQDAMTGGALASGENFDSNIAIGQSAMNSTGGEEQTGTIAIGSSALTALTTGVGNVAIGFEASDAVGTGSYNTVVGYKSLSTANTAAAGNSVLGHQAMFSANSATTSDNVAIGRAALTGGGGNLTDCIAIGPNALDDTAGNNQTGTIAIGADALTALTSGAGNTAVGYSALSQHTTGSRNIAIGYGSMDGTAGDADDAPASTDNISIGYDALGGNWADDEDSNFNVGIGNYVMDAAMDGALNNTAVGHNSGSAITSGDENSFFGSGAGVAVTSGIENTAIGKGALASQAGSHQSTAVGRSCLNQVNGTANSALGTQALYSCTSGANNTALGEKAGRYYGGSTGALATVNSGVYIGQDCRGNADSMTNEIVIGANAIGNGSNTATIGDDGVTDVYLGEAGRTATGRARDLVIGAQGGASIDATTNATTSWIATGGNVSTDNHWYGINNEQTIAVQNGSSKTASGINTTISWAHSTPWGSLNGITNSVTATTVGSGQSGDINGVNTTVTFTDADGDAQNIYGVKTLLDLNDGNTSTNVYGEYTEIDIEANHEAAGNVYGSYIKVVDDDASAGDAYGLTVEAGANVDACIQLIGGGIEFPATQAASSNANTLDDYEEGAISNPLKVDAGTITDYTGIDIVGCKYVKVGALVHAQYQIDTGSVNIETATGSGGSGAIVVNLPIAIASNIVFKGSASGYDGTNIFELWFTVSGSSDDVALYTDAAQTSTFNSSTTTRRFVMATLTYSVI